ncbi:hypothetical protein SAMN04489832_4731 [Micromonospora cremea]|uniref:Uncharacterized protein n=1 Tax=Micromonospora cremea TaxID=709881 RepID=A0A1N6A0U4_9ACTN|nr:hypothetical protein SAMN04489832_4731 [Micromonospora cremea]
MPRTLVATAPVSARLAAGPCLALMGLIARFVDLWSASLSPCLLSPRRLRVTRLALRPRRALGLA